MAASNGALELNLWNAAIAGSAFDVESLLAAGAKIDAKSDGRTALYFAAAHHQAAVVCVLITRGASMCTSDPFGKTPLHLVAAGIYVEDIKIVQALLGAKAPPFIADTAGKTALDVADEARNKATANAIRLASSWLRRRDAVCAWGTSLTPMGGGTTAGDRGSDPTAMAAGRSPGCSLQ